jgi:hypothetical protein
MDAGGSEGSGISGTSTASTSSMTLVRLRGLAGPMCCAGSGERESRADADADADAGSGAWFEGRSGSGGGAGIGAFELPVVFVVCGVMRSLPAGRPPYAGGASWRCARYALVWVVWGETAGLSLERA